jgi:DTW domain-containing protein YfiP
MKYCICKLIPSLDLKTKLSLVIHKNELKRTTNTGQLAVRALVNSEMHMLGQEGNPFHLESIILPQYHNLLFYPSTDAIELNADFLKEIDKPIHLIVPDGNWRQASKVHYRNQHITQLQRIKISQSNASQFYLRLETKPNGMATLEAIAHGLGLIEGLEVKNSLLTLYHEKLNRTLLSRGQRTSIMDQT